jgi:anti-sigma B factor antagonist
MNTVMSAIAIFQHLGLILLECCRCEIRRGTSEGVMALNLDVSRTGDIAVVRCRGRIVFGKEADELRGLILSLLKETNRIVLNLAWVVYVDSSGLGTLVASFISARHRGAEIKFAALSPKARRLFTITKVDRLFEVYDSAEEAVKSFLPHPDAAAS